MTTFQEPSLQASALPIRAWMISAWKSTTWSLPDDASHWERWRHVATVVLGGDTNTQLTGECVWALDTADATVGAAWEWIEWQPGVIILRDPMAIASNVVVFGDPEHPTSRAIALNTIAHQLPWRERVLRTIAEEEQARAWPAVRSVHSPQMRLAA